MNISHANISRATIDDLPGVLEIERAAFQMPWSKQDYLDSLQQGHILWILNVEECIVGCFLLRLVVDEGEILSFAIHPDFQRQGYGKLLLDFGTQQAMEQGCRDLFLEVRKTNCAAESLYHAAGFVKVGARGNYYQNSDGSREDAVVMHKNLS